MLQQTRVETVIPYFRRWMRRFPSVTALARARERDVLRLWEGLGYYARARNLHKAARVTVLRHSGKLPSDSEQLESLPGIGAYTAAAIASIAFGANEIALDTNARRVLARLFAVRVTSGSRRFDSLLQNSAMKIVAPGSAGDFNQALMDLGATICLSRQPHCELCPLSSVCKARQLGIQESLPARRKKAAIPHRSLVSAVVRRDGRVLIASRPSRGLLGGLWEFPTVPAAGNTAMSPSRGLASGIRRDYGVGVRRGRELVIINHTYSHFRVTVRAYDCELVKGTVAKHMRWVRPSRLEEYPMGRVDRRIAAVLSSKPRQSAPAGG